ncbi:MAG: hypothetical protein EPN23_06990 [Verrucomicrobia bacterium]|nr:MAG: hypothetical protein EPN23_06990 [Verrucomicrobiota bacterium]
MSTKNRRGLSPKIISILYLAIMAVWLLPLGAAATTGSWTVDAAGDWTNGANWASGTIPRLAGDIAWFTNDITAPSTVTLSSGVTNGAIFIGDANTTHSFTIGGAAGVLTFDSGGAADAALTQTATSKGDTISVGSLVLNSNLAVTNSAPAGTLNTLTISSIISDGASGSKGLSYFSVSNNAALALSGANTYSGGTVINGGKIVVNSAAALGTGIVTINGGGGGTISAVEIGVDTTIYGLVYNTASSQNLYGNTAALRILTIGAGGVVNASGAGQLNIGNTSNRPLSINLGASQAWTNNASSPIRLSDNGGTNSLNLNANTLTLAGTGDLQLFAQVIGTGGIIQDGSGTLTLTNANNTYSGSTIIKNGVLSVSGTGSLPGWDTAGRYAVSNGAALAVGNAVTDANITTMVGTGNFAAGAKLGFDTTAGNRTNGNVLADTVNGALGLVKMGANTLMLTNANTYSGGTLINAGTLYVNGDGALGAAGTSLLISNGATYQVSASFTNSNRAITLGVGGGKIMLNSGVTLGITNTIVGVGGLTQSGSGTLNLTASNAFSGGFTVNSSSTIKVGNNNALGTGTFTLNGGTWIPLGNYTITNAVVISANSLGNASSSAEFTGPFSGTGNWGVNGFANSKIKLSGDNSGWSGSWKFNGPPVLQLNNIHALGAGTTITFNTPASAGNNRGTLESLVALTGANAITQNVNLGSASGFPGEASIIKTTADMDLAGVITGAADALFVKDGPGRLTLSNTNTYSGATAVTNGTLALTSSGIISNSLVTVYSGAVVSNLGKMYGLVVNSGGLATGGGQYGTVTNMSGGTLTPGFGGDTNYVGDLTLSAGSTNLFYVKSYDTHDMSVVTNSLSYGGNNPLLKLDLTDWTPPVSSGTIVLYDNIFAGASGFDGTNNVFQLSDWGTGANSAQLLTNGASFWAVGGGTNGPITFTMHYDLNNDGTVNDIGLTYTVIPEPGAASLLGLVGVAFFMRRRIHRKKAAGISANS